MLARLIARDRGDHSVVVSLYQKSMVSVAVAAQVLDKENKSDFVVDWLYSQYHYSHPTLAERLAAIQKAASKVL